MKLIREQQEVLQPKIDEYRPRAKEEIIPWTEWNRNWKVFM